MHLNIPFKHINLNYRMVQQAKISKKGYNIEYVKLKTSNDGQSNIKHSIIIVETCDTLPCNMH